MGIGTIAPDDVRLRARFAQFLFESGSRDLGAGLQLASELGPTVAPVLWHMHAAEKSNARRRISVLAAAILAEGMAGDDRVLQSLDERTPLQDRLLTCFMLALQPTRTSARPEFWARALGKKPEPSQLLQVVALLASARFPAAAKEAPAGLLRDPDPGVVAAALFAGAPVPDAAVQRFFGREPPAHASLVHRGWLLGRLWRDEVVADGDAVVAQRAREVLLVPGEAHATARAAAALVLGRARAFDRDVRPDWRLLQLYAADAGAGALVRGWLTPAPAPLVEDPGRLAVAYVQSRDTAAVLADRAAWANAASVRTDIALALAARLCSQTDPVRIDWAVADLPEWWFVQWASNAAPARPQPFSDEVLQRAATLALDGRLPRAVARDLFEATLWRRASHPGLGLWQAMRELLRDLVLSGSVPGNRYHVGLPDHLRYVPGGLRHEDVFFDVAVEVFEFTSRAMPPIPAECRLR